MTCADAVKKLLKDKKRWEVRSAGMGSKGERWYAWAWIATASPRHSLLVRRHLRTGELAFHYCFVPEGQLASKARLIRATGLRWPVDPRLAGRAPNTSATCSAPVPWPPGRPTPHGTAPGPPLYSAEAGLGGPRVALVPTYCFPGTARSS